MSEPEINAALREHVTSVGFNLSLGKTHVATLVALDKMLAANRHVDTRTRNLRMFVPAVDGLVRRGLVIYTYPTQRNPPVRTVWKISSAGRHVIALLKESGLYEEYGSGMVLAPKRESA